MMMAVVAVYAGCRPAMAADVYLADMIKKPAYARALKRLLDHGGSLPSWTWELLKPKGAYVGVPVTYAVIDGIAYEMFFNCEQQNCDVSDLTVMFAPNGTQAWGVHFQEGTFSYIGAPSSAQQAALKATINSPNRN